MRRRKISLLNLITAIASITYFIWTISVHFQMNNKFISSWVLHFFYLVSKTHGVYCQSVHSVTCWCTIILNSRNKVERPRNLSLSHHILVIKLISDIVYYVRERFRFPKRKSILTYKLCKLGSRYIFM